PPPPRSTLFPYTTLFRSSAYSSPHMCTTDLMASSAAARLVSRSTPNAVCSMGVERPVPHSTRPLDRTSTVATFSATRIGGVKPRSEEHTSELQSRGHLVC